MRFIYSVAIYFYLFLIYLSSPFSKKASLWIQGRKNIFLFLKEKCKNKKIVWIHTASLGEYEQGKPLIERIKQELPDITILCTFFSPSGYEVKKNDTLPHIISYLPLDTPSQVKQFLDVVNPIATFFIKYEYWYNFMHQLAERDIPFYYVSAIYREEQPFFKWYGKWFRKHLQKCTFFYVQNEKSLLLLQSIGINQAKIIGDTRFDRVYQIATQRTELSAITDFKQEKKILVCGSTWQEDEKVIYELYKQIYPKYKLIIAPHLTHEEHIINIEKRFSSYKTVRYSEKKGKNISAYNVLIVDSIGLLSKLYAYGEFAFIGGGFKTGLHNILEAVVYHIPIFFGPKFSKFNEAKELVALQVAFSVSTASTLIQIFNQLDKEKEQYRLIQEKAKKYIENNLGAVKKIDFSSFSFK